MTILPYQPHSETSHQAAIEAESCAENARGMVYRMIREVGTYGCTDEELQDALEMNPSTERPRRVELVFRGLVCDSGLRRKTKAGRLATVWVERRDEAEQMELML